ncbi:AfsR/SARP family transcriptional regulator [Nonomuraea typhae]|uniref:AfsR/SARP family transcriptional regulator n=1 Tax=Nonomuraea typhae TaxID=2603600 RepID=UPI0012FB496A|nr:AfsR/SARP family transcriptional regulator [Nonomuraea typhae]
MNPNPPFPSRPPGVSGALGVLGPLVGPGGVVPGAAKHRAVLAALLLSPGRTVPLARLMAVVWDDDPPVSAEPVLRVYISALRKLVEGIRTVPGGYLLEVEPERVDWYRFEQLVERGRRARGAGNLSQAADALRAALGLWRGTVALADVDSAHLRRSHAVPLEELRLSALEERVELDLQLGRGGEVVGELRALVGAYPLRERAWAQLITALRLAGRRSDALAAYQDARRVLVDELGLEPGAELREAHAKVLQGEETVAPPYEVPPDISDFTGRAAVLRWIRDATPPPSGAPVHLVLHGAPGSGKTAVAVHAAALAAGGFPGGVLFATLRERAPGAVLEDLLRSLGCPEGAVPAAMAERVRLYRSMTASRRLLVVLDDAVDEARVRPLLPTGAGSMTLITSRSPLSGLEASRAFELGVLNPQEAVDLLAEMAGPGRLAAEPEAAARIAHLCGHLPLALRVAGSRLARKPGWTLAHLAGRLSDERRRLDELAAGDLAVRGSLALGYDGLADRERALFRRLGVLSAPDFAAWVFGDLEGLAEAGLLQSRGLDESGQERYGWHDLTRIYAAECLTTEEPLPAAGEVLRDVAGEVLDRARRARRLLLPAEPGSGRTVARTEEQMPATIMLRESAGWLRSERRFLSACVNDFHRAGLHEAAWRLAFYLAPFYELGAHHDDWHETTATGLDAARAAGHRQGEALLLRGLADLHRREGNTAAAAAALRAAQPLVQGLELARVTLRLGLVTGDERAFTRCLAVFEEAGDQRGRADTLRALGALRGDRRLLEESLAGYLALGDPRGEAEALLGLAVQHLEGGRLKEARECAERRLVINRRLGDRLPEAASLLALARIARAEGRPDARVAAQAAEVFREFGDRRGTGQALLVRAEAHLDLDEVDVAVEVIESAMGEFDLLGDRPGLAEADRLAREARRRRGLYGS